MTSRPGTTAAAPFTVDHLLPDDFFSNALRADARAGLTSVPKSLPPRWFYDARGSELFEEITRLKEYYPTRAEREILETRSAEIAAATGARTLVELGSGSSEKTRLLLDALAAAGTLAGYVPVDVSESALTQAAARLQETFPRLAVHAQIADFQEHLGLADDADNTDDATEGPRLLAFLGGTIGNLEPTERAAFFTRVAAALRPDDTLLLGTDLVKDPATLIAAYDDAAGVTAEFNKNVLAVLNRELDAAFDPDAFSHVAVWDAEREWIEMRLRAREDLTVKVRGLDLAVSFARGEELRTEVSAKFRREGIRAELERAGLELRHWWTDAAGRYALSLAGPYERSTR
ncbi:L-histidine N(alpha)-methyltransferase [Streptomyces sp. A7024]|uniref:Histidine N-alpha-methyltransferase n=1 Tax=Streptomyces coryli TaxID=1128680 RepID=A0A6G4UER3_9ACTN|nr:L-histidine N(alpha)-methyltransferase [Streptomyces coryli]NGN70087.1 L-histidine N(alpha)-methyltransferase [Streptomyces coryli]